MLMNSSIYSLDCRWNCCPTRVARRSVQKRTFCRENESQRANCCHRHAPLLCWNPNALDAASRLCVPVQSLLLACLAGYLARPPGHDPPTALCRHGRGRYIRFMDTCCGNCSDPLLSANALTESNNPKLSRMARDTIGNFISSPLIVNSFLSQAVLYRFPFDFMLNATT